MFYILILIIIILYVWSYYNYNQNLDILQINYNNTVDDSIVYEKLPIVIYDTNDIIDLFKYKYIFKNIKSIENDIYKNKNKYTIVIPQDDQTFLDVIHPKYKIKNWNSDNILYVTVKLNKNQSLVLPSHWSIKTEQKINLIELNDIITIFLSKIKL